jgi:hypothetical protein
MHSKHMRPIHGLSCGARVRGITPSLACDAVSPGVDEASVIAGLQRLAAGERR